ncbi:MAG: DUF885 domain-containing protein [Hyphomonadaceae bacterium]|nr:DUF885 domain-containing protein [Hyphomonadaceae bacterium]
MLKWLIAALGLVLSAPRAHADAAAEFRAIVADYDAFARAADPIRAASRGDAAAARLWPDNSPAAVAARAAALRALSARLDAVGGLPAAEAMERAILVYRLQDASDGAAFDEERVPFISGEGFFANPDYAATLTVLRSRADAEAWLARLEAIPAYYERETANMRRAIGTRFTQPALVVRNTIRGVRAQAAIPSEESPLMAPLGRLPDAIPETERRALRARGAEIYHTRIVPALAALGDFLERDYLPAARPRLGVRSLPGGARYYEYLVRKHTTTRLTPAQVHALGVAEVARVRSEMEAVIRESNFSGSFAEFIAFLRSDPQFYPRDAVELERITSEVANRANLALPRYFAVLPRNTYGITFIPSALETGSAGYWPGNLAQGAPGQVLLRRTTAERRSLYDLPAWVLHEGSPGHHTQIALAEEIEGLPDYRRSDDITAFVEGWALYAERLGEEMGIYRTPYERFGRLSMEMWRACRLVIDTGVHWMGWSRERAVACLRDNSALTQSEIEREVDRYIGWPGQALAYKVGEIEIRDLRARAERTLGACFDLRAFHDALLSAGALPMAVLRTRMEGWTATRACPAAS